MATRETEAAAALEACAGFWQGRTPFKVRDPRVEPQVRDTLADGRDQSTVTVCDVTLQPTPKGGWVMVTREDRFARIGRFRFTLEQWREIARDLRVIHVAAYQAGESAPGRVLS